MIRPILEDHLIFRVPRFSYKDKLAENWTELKSMIAYSSPEFYQLIKEMRVEDLAMADQKVQMTVRKYFNRAQFRSTPYGTFATVGIAKFDRHEHNVAQLEKRIVAHAFIDWTATQNLKSDAFHPGISFFSNSSFYRVQDQIRYLKKNENDFQAAAIDFDELIWELLEYCNPPKKPDQITCHFSHLDSDEIKGLLSELINLQLMLTSDHANIIGEDYFKRIQAKPEQMVKPYLIAEREIQNGGFDKKTFRYIPELIECLQKLAGSNTSADLRSFRNHFIRRYEQAEVPLLEALDPEAGPGYGSFTSQVGSSPLTRLAAIRDEDDNIGEDALRNKLIAEIIAAREAGKTVELERLIPLDKKVNPLPNSLTVLCNVVDGEVWLDFAGGASGISILGRFAHAIPAIEQYCKNIAASEQQANPGVLFFDIGYTKEISVDNINRRPAIYDTQLNILNYDTSSSPLGLNDILISVQNNEVLLRSKSLGKRLIPRLSTMYNYKRSDLSLFRLLMDIQYQGIASQLMINVTKLAPGLSYYPRVQFRNIIVSPAIWKIQAEIVFKDCPKDKKRECLSTHLKSVLTCSHIRTGVADQTLLLNVEKDTDIDLMLDRLEKNKELLLEEARLPVTPIVIDQRKKPLLAQLVLTLSHTQKIFDPMRLSRSGQSEIARNTWVAPGEEWLYFEIYISPYRSDTLLNDKISRFLNLNRKRIKAWFFIRYTEDGEHIRLRLKVSGQQHGYILIKRLSESLREELNAGIVSDIKLRIYRKEIQRYSAELIDKVEDHFHKDSQFVLSMLSNMLTDTAKYRLCVDVLETIAKSDLLTEEEYELSARQMERYLSTEHGITTEDYKEINKTYRSYLKEDFPGLSTRAAVLHQRLIVSFIDTIRQYGAATRPQILADLIHMHINRLFAKDQRLHELIIYNFYLNQQTARRKRQLSKALAN